MVIDAKVKHYRSGGCFAMAEALHRLTGHPIRYIDFGNLIHAFVLTPDDEVLDIHGKLPWKDFLDFLVKEGTLPKGSVARGDVQCLDIPDPSANILWRHLGFKLPTETAINRALADAREHPNLVGLIADTPRPRLK